MGLAPVPLLLLFLCLLELVSPDICWMSGLGKSLQGMGLAPVLSAVVVSVSVGIDVGIGVGLS